MRTDELAREYIAKIEQQQGQPLWPSLLSRGRGARAHLEGQRYCEECGLLPVNGQSICPRCRASFRSWLQFIGLAMLGILTAYNYILVLNFPLRRVVPENVAAVWLTVSQFAWLYGWILLAAYVPAWAYYCWKKHDHAPETSVWVALGFIVVLLLGTAARFIFSGMRWASGERLLTLLDSRPELGIALGWAVVALALVSICCNRQSRDRILGRGKGLALLALAVLCTLLALSLLVIRHNAHL